MKQEKTGIYLIGEIISRRFVNNKRQYLVKWKDYPKQFNSWEPYESLQAVWDTIDEYDKKHPDRRIKDKKKKEPEVKQKVAKQNNLPKRGSKVKKIVVEKPHYKSKPTTKKEEKPVKPEKKETEKEKEKAKEKNSNILIKPDFEESSSYPCEPDFVVKLDIHLDGKLQAQIKWMNKAVSAVDYESFKMRYPQKLIEFFESRIVFPFENSGTRKFLDIHKKKEE